MNPQLEQSLDLLEDSLQAVSLDILTANKMLDVFLPDEQSDRIEWKAALSILNRAMTEVTHAVTQFNFIQREVRNESNIVYTCGDSNHTVVS